MFQSHYAVPISFRQSGLSRRRFLVSSFGCFISANIAFNTAFAVDAAPLLEVVSPVHLILQDGSEVHIPDILPDGLDRHPIDHDTPWAQAARAAIRQWAGTSPLQITPLSPERDRYGRMRADVSIPSSSRKTSHLATDLVQRGFARVFPEPETPTKRIEKLLVAEREARNLRAGAWRDGTFRIINEKHPLPESDRFEIVTGLVMGVSRVGSRVHLEFGTDWRTDFTLGLNPPILRSLTREGINPLALAAQSVEARGWVRWWNGPFMEVDRRDQLLFDLGGED